MVIISAKIIEGVENKKILIKKEQLKRQKMTEGKQDNPDDFLEKSLGKL